MESLFPNDNPRCSGAKILHKTVTAHGTNLLRVVSVVLHEEAAVFFPFAIRATIRNVSLFCTRGNIGILHMCSVVFEQHAVIPVEGSLVSFFFLQLFGLCSYSFGAGGIIF